MTPGPRPADPPWPRVLRVAAAQAVSVPGDVVGNVATAAGLVGEAAAGGARLVVLPELFLSGYDEAAWAGPGVLTEDDPRLDPLREAARAGGVAVVVGAAVRREASLTLSAVVLGPDGRGGASYDKQHLSGSEPDHFTRGDHGASLVLDGWELGLGVCYDGSFPEHAAAAAADGACGYLASAAFFSGSEHRRDLYFAARALDNGLYVVLAGLVGTCGPHRFGGGSAVYDPEGRPVARAGAAERAVVLADLDPAEVSRVRTEHPMGRDRIRDLGVRRRVILDA